MCSLCASTFGRRCELKRHVAEVHTQNGARRFRCTHPACNKSFTRRDALAKHHVVKHQGKRRFICPTCSEKFTSRYDLSRHTIRVHSNVKKRFTCEHCAAGFSQKSQLTMHKGRVHASRPTTPQPLQSHCENVDLPSSGAATEADECMSQCNMQIDTAPGAIDSLAAVAVAMAQEDGANQSRRKPPNEKILHIKQEPTHAISEVEAAVRAADAFLEAAAVLQPTNDRRVMSDTAASTAASTADTELPYDMSEHDGEETGPINTDESAERCGAEAKATVTNTVEADEEFSPTVRGEDSDVKMKVKVEAM